jgi:hypothetical protein
MNFKNDLKFGKKYEMELLKYLDYDIYKTKDGLFKEYDLKIYKNNKSIRYEVKADRLSYKTNNIAIEYECSKKDSGITKTTSKYYAYFIIKPNDNYDLYIIPTKDIKTFIKENKFIRIVLGGDNYNSKMYLFNVNIFKNFIIKSN